MSEEFTLEVFFRSLYLAAQRRGLWRREHEVEKKKFQDGGCFSFAVEDFEVVLG